jgi:hypothetical protein
MKCTFVLTANPRLVDCILCTWSGNRVLKLQCSVPPTVLSGACR